MRVWRPVGILADLQGPRSAWVSSRKRRSRPQSGSTALWMSRLNAGVPIYALTPEVSARNQMTLYREVHPLLMSQTHQDRDVLLWEAEQVLLEQGVVDYGDLIVLTIGEPIGAAGGTNTLKIVRVGDHQAPNSDG